MLAVRRLPRSEGLILVDTKYEFGKRDGKVYLIDEIHTPDSSRYFYAEGYEEKLAKGEPQKQLSKEFVRQWLIEHNFMNEPGQVMPEITDEYAESVSERYIELYEHIIGEKFEKAADNADIAARIEKNVSEYLATRLGFRVSGVSGFRFLRLARVLRPCEATSNYKFQVKEKCISKRR